MGFPLKEILGVVPGFFGIHTEEAPEHTVAVDDGEFQLRKYAPLTTAEVTINGDRDFAMNEAFPILARYIFGKNKTKTQMSMTTPVVQAKAGPPSMTMSMTTPVMQSEKENGWTMSFLLERGMTLESAPTPLDDRVKLVSVPAKTVATYRYSGNNTEKRMRAGKEKILAWIAEKGLSASSEVTWAQYDQPFAIPMLKRNEAHVEVSGWLN